ncbi:hypothetical protein HMPREF9148_00125 [Prevotella sp. F0091]|nr:hypothetical protein HMPREF9148_00125 [Prevotella sp. F0091]
MTHPLFYVFKLSINSVSDVDSYYWLVPSLRISIFLCNFVFKPIMIHSIACIN